MYHFVNFGAHKNTLDSIFCRNTKNSIISEIQKNSKITDTEVHKIVHLVS